MKKIGILTYHPYDNYGAVLQAYALQKVLSSNYNATVEIINFCTVEQEKENRVIKVSKNNSLRANVSIVLFRLPILKQLLNRKRRFKSFRDIFLNTTVRYQSPESLFNNLPKEDVYISGSDQVFNPYAKYCEVYYLGFPVNNAKKVAYAPSFGVSNLEDSVDEKLKGYIKDFNYISCREQTGGYFLSELLGKVVPCVADPVFLLPKNEWCKIARKPNSDKPLNEGYVFVYLLNGGRDLMVLANKISCTLGLPILCVAPDMRYVMDCKGVDFSVGPLEMLGLIRDASLVVTDSFHGTALSLVLETKVVSYIARPSTSDRIVTIMHQLGLDQNVVYDVEQFRFEQLSFPDYSQLMDSYVKKSKHYLEEALK